MMRAALTDGPEQHVGESAMSAAAEHEQVRPGRLADEYLRRIPLDRPPLDLDIRSRGPGILDGLRKGPASGKRILPDADGLDGSAKDLGFTNRSAQRGYR